MLDRERLRQNHFEVSFVVGRFLSEHLIRVHNAFEGDLVAAVVLGTIGQYNFRHFYERFKDHPAESYQVLVERGAYAEHLRPCNALSVSASTGIPRETVRRKIRWLIDRGWLRQIGRDKLLVTIEVARHFAEFDLATLEHFHAAAHEVLGLVEKHGPNDRAAARKP